MPSLLLGQHSGDDLEQSRCESKLHYDIMHVLIFDFDGCFQREGASEVMPILVFGVSEDGRKLVDHFGQLQAQMELFCQTDTLFEVAGVDEVDLLEICLFSLLTPFLGVEVSAEDDAVVLELLLGFIHEEGQLDEDVAVAWEVYIALGGFVDDWVFVRRGVVCKVSDAWPFGREATGCEDSGIL
jgi:hypothetical protein